MKAFLKSTLKGILRGLLRVPGLDSATMGLLGGLLRAGQGWLRSHPERYLTVYKLVRLAHREMGLREQSQSVAARAWGRLDEELERQIRAFLREEKDLALVKRINAAIISFERDERIVRVKGLPFRMYLEPTSQCNLRCRMCTQAIVTDTRRYYLDLTLLDRMEPLLRAVSTVCLTGWGESLLHKQFRELFQRVRGMGASVSLITNGILLTREMAEFLVENHLEELSVSLDSTDPETYEFVRGVDKLDVIRENLRYLKEVKERLGTDLPRVHLNYAFMQRNAAELPGYMRMAKELGAVGVGAAYAVIYSENMREQSLYYDKEKANRTLREARAVAEELGVHFFGVEEFDLQWEERKRTEGRTDAEGRFRSCNDLWEFTYVNCRGAVFPCCVDTTQLGDLLEQDFETIWNSARYQAYRRSLSTREPSPYCRHCIMMQQRGINDPENHFRIFTEEGKLAAAEKGEG